jgi:hypothetical protein
VTGVAVAWLDFGCRFVLGMPSCATRSHTTLPVRLSSATSFHVCFDMSFAGSTSPYNPVRMPAEASLETAVETNTRSPHTIGLDTATPATGVVHSTLSPVFTFQVTGVGALSPTPAARGPRNIGQFCADSVAVASTNARTRMARMESI